MIFNARSATLLGLLYTLASVPSCEGACEDLYENANIVDGYCARQFAGGVNGPRGMWMTSTGDLLAVEREGVTRVSVFWDEDNDGLSSSNERAVLAAAPKLNHGITVSGGYLYASSDTTVYRWPYTDGQREDLGTYEVVVENINADGNGGAPMGHKTRSLVVDKQNRLYVQVGSLGNVDDDSFRSRIRRFDITDTSSFPFDFIKGEVFIDGVRNEVGLAFDASGLLWGVENGADRLIRGDLGGDIHDDNPAEELNAFPEENAGKFYGYPYCFSEFKLPAEYSIGPGAQFVWPSFKGTGPGKYTDDWCRDPANVVPPRVSFQAHSAPLGIEFYLNSESCGEEGAFPCDMVGDAFVAFHGSWNRNIPTGYKVVRVHFKDGEPTGEVTDFFWHGGSGAKWPNGFRPVDVKFSPDGKRMFVSSAMSNEILLIGSSLPPLPKSTETNEEEPTNGDKTDEKNEENTTKDTTTATATPVAAEGSVDSSSGMCQSHRCRSVMGVATLSALLFSGIAVQLMNM